MSEKPTEVSVGISPLEDRVVLCAGAERIGLTLEQAMHVAKMLMDTGQQLIDAQKRAAQ